MGPSGEAGSSAGKELLSGACGWDPWHHLRERDTGPSPAGRRISGPLTGTECTSPLLLPHHTMSQSICWASLALLPQASAAGGNSPRAWQSSSCLTREPAQGKQGPHPQSTCSFPGSSLARHHRQGRKASPLAGGPKGLPAPRSHGRRVRGWGQCPLPAHCKSQSPSANVWFMISLCLLPGFLLQP